MPRFPCMGEFRLPNLTQRLTAVGRTGSGKTQSAAWALSEARYDKQPFVIVDYKYDKLLCDIPHVQEISLKRLPKKPGLYITHPVPEVDDDAVDRFMRHAWEHENIGLFIDEAYALPGGGRSPAFRALLTQGRSKHIPMIICTQRPAFVSRFVFSEADYFSVFPLSQRKDQLEIEAYHEDLDLRQQIPKYWSRYVDVAENKIFLLKPVPDKDIILQTFEDRLKPNRRHI